MRGAWVLGVLIAVLATSVARADPIVSLGPTAGAPSVATDPSGTLHAVWHTYEQLPGPDMLSYCAVPAGGTVCTPRILGGFPSINVGNPHLLIRPRDGALIVVVPGNDADAKNVTFVLASLDGGATWSGPTIEGRGQYDIDSVSLTPDGNFVDTLEGFVQQMSWQRIPLAGPEETRVVSLTREPSGADTGYVFSASTGYLPDGRAAIFGFSPQSSPDAGGRYRALAPGADPYVNASWTPWSASPHLGGTSIAPAIGPIGVWALTHDSVAAGQGLLVARLNGSRFTRPSKIGVKPFDINGSAFTQDAGGRLHVAWGRDGYCGPGRACVIYRRGGRRGFSDPVLYPLPTTISSPESVRLAPNASGAGWMMLRPNGGGQNAYVAPLVAPLPGTTPASRRLGGTRRVTLATRNACVAPGGRYAFSVSLSGHARTVRIVSVRFALDGKPVTTDRRAPYRGSVVLPFAAGTRHVASARVSYRRDGRLRHAELGRPVVVCP